MIVQSGVRQSRNTIRLVTLRILTFVVFVLFIFLLLIQYWTMQFASLADEQRRQILLQMVTLSRNSIEPILIRVRAGEVSRENGLSEVRNLVRQMTYKDQYGDNYIFMSAYDGTMLVQPFEPKKENTNQWDLKDDRGLYIIRGLIQTAKENPEGGFFSYYYPPPKTSSSEEKLSYVVGIPELDCYIGTGMYMQREYKAQTILVQQTWLGALLIIVLFAGTVLFSLQQISSQQRILEKEIFEHAKAQEALEISEERLKYALHNVNDGLWDWHPQSGNTYFSPHWYSMLGYNEKEFKASFENWRNLVHPDDLGSVEEEIQVLLTGSQEDYAAEYRMRCQDGTWKWILARGKATERDQSGKALRIIGTHTNITDLKQAQQEVLKLNAELENRVNVRTAQLEEMNKELEAFAYSVSHDLRAPLRSIDGFSQILLEDYSARLDEEGRRMLTRVRNSVQKMNGLIDDLLDLSRLTKGELNRVPVNISQMAQTIINEFCFAEPERQIDVIIAENIFINVDERLFRVALENLLGNAWKFTSKVLIPRIEIGVTRSEDEENIYFVRDNGVGFDMTYVNRLFSAFQRLHNANDFPGTGIGLAIVQRIIHRHGGRIWAESIPGDRTTFYFTVE